MPRSSRWRTSSAISAKPGPASSKLATVLKAVLEVRKPSIFGELIIALTFIPIIALQGIEGKMFLPLAFTHIIALMASLLLSVLVIPAFCHAPAASPHADKESFLVAGAHQGLPAGAALGAAAQAGRDRDLPGPAGRDSYS